MPVYESTKNADNKIVISSKNRDSVVFGWEQVVSALSKLAGSGSMNIALDGWYGIDFAKIAKALSKCLEEQGKNVLLIPATKLYVSREEIIAYNQPYVTDDPGFGKVNKNGRIEDIMSSEAVNTVKEKLARKENQVGIIYGTGAGIQAFAELLDVTCYIDNTHQKVQWDMWDGVRRRAFSGKRRMWQA